MFTQLLQVISCLIITNIVCRPTSGSISQLKFSLTYSRVLVTPNSHDYLKVSGQCMYIGLADGTIEQRNFINNNTLIMLFNNTLSFGKLVQALQINEGKLITIHNNKLIAVWNISTGLLIKYKYSSYTVFRSAFIKEREILIIGIKQQRGFELVQMSNLHSTILFYDPINYTNHRFALSPNEQIIIDWQTPDLPVRILNLTSSTITILQSYIGNYSYVYERFIALFSSDSNEVIYCTNGTLNFHNIRNSYYPSKKLNLIGLNLQITSIMFLNEQEKIYFLSKVGNQSVVYDQITNQSVTITTPNSQGDTLSQNKRYIIRFHQNVVSVLKISCINNYFYNNSAALCQPCFINNCSTCDSDTGFCSSCFQNNSYITINGSCLPCEQFCQSCTNINGNCNICEQPYKLSDDFHCTLPTKQYLSVLRYVIAIIYASKLKVTSLLIMFLNQFELYNYHNRQYGNNTLSYLKPINFLQLSKWFILPINNIDYIFNPLRIFSSYLKYTSNVKFTQESQLDYSFWNSLFFYFVQSIPQAVFVYIIMRLIFFLIYNFKLSTFIRQYSFYLFILPCVFSNHLQYLTYTSGNQLQKLIYLTFWDKLCLIMFILFLFLAFLYMVAFLLLVLIYHRKTKKYFFDDNNPNLMGAFTLNLFNSYQAFLLSIIQSFLYQRYILQMFLMITIEILVIIGLIFMEKRYKSFEKKITFCSILLNQSLMIVFNIILVLDYYYRSQQDQLTMNLTDSIAQVIIISILINIAFYVLSCLVPSKYFKKSNSKERAKDQSKSKSKSQKQIERVSAVDIVPKQQQLPVNITRQNNINEQLLVLQYQQQPQQIQTINKRVFIVPKKKEIYVTATKVNRKKKEIAVRNQS